MCSPANSAWAAPPAALREGCIRNDTRAAFHRRKSRRSANDSCSGSRSCSLRWKVSVPAAQRARENFVHVLLNHNDFVTIR